MVIYGRALACGSLTLIETKKKEDDETQCSRFIKVTSKGPNLNVLKKITSPLAPYPAAFSDSSEQLHGQS